MYESFFQLSARPFLVSPLAERYFPAGAGEYARETVARCIERAEGTALIIGGAGTGKSTVCQVLAEQFRSQFRVAMLNSARLCTRRALLQNILFELKLPYREREEGELRLSLIDYLEPSDVCPNGLLLLVDEAHTLPMRLLEELRMITNLVRDGQPRVRLVLAANLSFEERLASPRLESFNQRIVARCYLQSMSRDETCEYVRAQFRAVNGDPQRIISEDALQSVFRATDGIPRLVNQLADHVLMMAAVGRRNRVDAQGVEEAWADLQQLPSPWSGEQSISAPGDADILEFGELDGETVGELDDAHPDTEPEETGAESYEIEAPECRAENRVNAIESQLAAISEQQRTADGCVESSDEFMPPTGRSPEIELVFHRAHDPFSEPFENEEVVVDAPSSVDGLPTDEQMAQSDVRKSHASTIPFCVQETAQIQAGGPGSECDPVLPESLEAPVSCPAAELDEQDESVPGDDRDLLEVFNDESSELVTSLPRPKPQPKRREYRQLFASLRARS